MDYIFSGNIEEGNLELYQKACGFFNFTKIENNKLYRNQNDISIIWVLIIALKAAQNIYNYKDNYFKEEIFRKFMSPEEFKKFKENEIQNL